MIVLSEDRYVTTMPGYITLQDSDGVYYYIHKNLYEQAVVVEDRYGEDVDRLVELIGGNKENPAIEKFVKYVPRPVSIMGYFLALVTEDIDDFTDAVGALDVISSTINLRNLIKFPVEVRQTVQFGMSVKNEYQDAWDHFLESCYKYEDVKGALSGNFNQPVRTRRQQVVDDDEPEYEEEEVAADNSVDDMSEEELEAKRMAEFNASFDAILAGLDNPEEKQEEEEKPETPLEKIPASLGGNGLAAIAQEKARRRRAL